MDKAKAEREFARLVTEHCFIDPKIIRIWGIRNGWEPRHADKLAALAAKAIKQ